MTDDLQELIKDLKKKVKNRQSSVHPMELQKIDIKKQKQEFFDFLESYDNEIKKDDENSYVHTLIKDFRRMKLMDIRFVVEKTYDKYSKMLNIINKFDDNFSEEEVERYKNKEQILNKVVSYMVINHVGEYVDEEDSDS